MDLDGILKENGQFGRYQIFICTLLFFPIVFTTAAGFAYMFTTDDTEYRCVIEECEGNNTDSYDQFWLPWAIPNSEDENRDRCLRFQFSKNQRSNNCSQESFNSATLYCNEFIYKNDENTITKEFNLQCGKNKWKRTIIGTLNTLAQFIGMPVAGIISDRYGRKNLIIGSVLLTSVFGTWKSFSSSYLEFLVFEILDGIASSGIYAASYVFGIENIGPDRRGLAGTLLSCFGSIGPILLGIIVWQIHDWRNYLRILYMPGFLIILYYWIFPESLRWTFLHGKNRDIVKSLDRYAYINRKPVSKSLGNYVEGLGVHNSATEELITTVKPDKTEKEKKIIDLMKSHTIFLRILNCCFCWITNTFVYYGLSLAAVIISGDKYINFILISLTEIPGYFISWIFVDRLGRKILLILGLIVSGISCTAFHFIQGGDGYVKLALFMIGKLGITVSFTTLYTVASEIYPTYARNTLVGFCSTIGRIGSMAAPQLSLIAEVLDPFLIFGGISLVSGILALYFPETCNSKLPDTLEEAVLLGTKSTKQSQSGGGLRKE